MFRPRDLILVCVSFIVRSTLGVQGLRLGGLRPGVGVRVVEVVGLPTRDLNIIL